MSDKASRRDWVAISAALQQSTAAHLAPVTRWQNILDWVENVVQPLLSGKQDTEVPVTQTPLQQIAAVLRQELDAVDLSWGQRAQRECICALCNTQCHGRLWPGANPPTR
jgi:hypothetical protein